MNYSGLNAAVIGRRYDMNYPSIDDLLGKFDLSYFDALVHDGFIRNVVILMAYGNSVLPFLPDRAANDKGSSAVMDLLAKPGEPA